ncbi:Mitochondrial distribution and morphology protein 10 [Quaeritorhiza haematococci]|nr:Mitochondrial distribution and morphology protein 10 [Quaeritorhiza haematococci]
MYTSDDNVVGISGLYNFEGTSWSGGGEIYYTGKEKSGGLSVGARYHRKYAPGVHSILTFVANPMMGHITSSYTTTVRPNMDLSTRYDFNTYSYESDLAVGMEYAPQGKDQLMKARVSLSQGLALKLESRYKRALFSIGLMTEFAHRPRRSIGIEVQIG